MKLQRYTRGTRLHSDDRKYVLAAYVHRTLGGFAISKDDERWLKTYSFATRVTYYTQESRLKKYYLNVTRRPYSL